MKLISFTLSGQVVTPQTGTSIESNCNGIVFRNIGTDVVTILGNPMQPGESFTPPCNVGEIDQTNYLATFAGATTNQKLLVIRKKYSGIGID
jgi:hypothetical protein